MDGDVEVLRRVYDRFNARDIDGVLAVLADDVVWANGMDGGHVHGREAVREYWTRQWAMVSPHVEPVDFAKAADGSIVAEVRQTSAISKASRTGPNARAEGQNGRTRLPLASGQGRPLRHPR